MPVAAVVRIGGDAEQAELAEFLPELRRELVALVDLGRQRRDAFLREAVHHLAQRVDILTKPEIQRMRVHRVSPWAFVAAYEAHRH